MSDVFILDCILSDDQEQVSDEIHQMDELDFETFEPREDKNAGFKEVTRLQEVRHLDRSIGDSLKLLYDYRCQMTGERIGDNYDALVVEAHHITSSPSPNQWTTTRQTLSFYRHRIIE